jgi:hypothetical protein
MKTSQKKEKNICKNRPFFEGFIYIKNRAAKIQGLSGFPNMSASKIPPEAAVNTAEFFQRGGDPQ